MCCLKIFRIYFSNTNRESNETFPQNTNPTNVTTPRQGERASTHTVVTIDNDTIIVPIPSSSNAHSLLIKYQKSPEYKDDFTISSSAQSLFFVVLYYEVSERNPDFPRAQLPIISRKAWDLADQEYKDAYELLLEHEEVKKCFDD
ncbi:614_t:CDS:1 [Funneliformis geosporum]|uniref:12763_t:CDS:1 n=1 Tax=Funneliformis geosporum TaxID=1117311 RepID=A0A9W4WJ76_9GLOM|nr:614_t:CDS:1 [Funneliformis geosporum]CAI2165713.1 12763_t:CDS:1 [Funneliformis geosporum]